MVFIGMSLLHAGKRMQVRAGCPKNASSCPCVTLTPHTPVAGTPSETSRRSAAGTWRSWRTRCSRPSSCRWCAPGLGAHSCTRRVPCGGAGLQCNAPLLRVMPWFHTECQSVMHAVAGSVHVAEGCLAWHAPQLCAKRFLRSTALLRDCLQAVKAGRLPAGSCQVQGVKGPCGAVSQRPAS